ncbi:patatin-like phospholipase family protein [Thalassospira sp. CH_XMU1458]|uniref:patatin-like phospholipase family protein n=1 Tax=Thalassospira sp. CH_XMU1458 TaxID=3107776 RepID=UPI00300CAEFD
MFKILSIDGGGIRGVIPGTILQHIETEIGKPISEIFDLIFGTSTGGILAAGLTVPGANNKPKFSAAEMVTLYTEHGADIFHQSPWDKVSSGGGVWDELYSHKNLEQLLKQRLGETELKDTLCPIALTSYDIELRQPYFFKTSRAQKSSGRNHLLRDAARATSAAPTYFEPAEIMSLSRPQVRRALIDGGVFVNNPTICAYAEAKTLSYRDEDLLVVSLGTGVGNWKIPYDDAKDWGKVGWVRPLISVMMDGASDAVDFQMNQLLPGNGSGKKQRYFRLDTDLKLASEEMDDPKPGNIQNLKDEANRIIEENTAQLETLFKLLDKK